MEDQILSHLSKVASFRYEEEKIVIKMLQSKQTFEDLVTQTIYGPAPDFLNHSLMMYQLIRCWPTPCPEQTLVLKLLMKQFAYPQACYCLMGAISFQTVKCTGRRPLLRYFYTMSDSMHCDTFARIPRSLDLCDNEQLGK